MESEKTACQTIFLARAGVLLMGTLAAWGQTPTGSIGGRLADPADLPVADCRIGLIERSTERQVSVRTNSLRLYSATNLLPGEYRLSVKLPGFESVEITGISVQAGAVAPENNPYPFHNNFTSDVKLERAVRWELRAT